MSTSNYYYLDISNEKTEAHRDLSHLSMGFLILKSRFLIALYQGPQVRLGPAIPVYHLEMQSPRPTPESETLQVGVGPAIGVSQNFPGDSDTGSG